MSKAGLPPAPAKSQRSVETLSARTVGGAKTGVTLAEAAASVVEGLTPRQRQVLEMVIAGKRSKIIAADLGISQRTVENHRAAIMKHTNAKSIPDLMRLFFATK